MEKIKECFSRSPMIQSKKSNTIPFFAVAIIMVLIAFYRGFEITHDLNWPCDLDFDRDMAFIYGILGGHFGEDPNYRGEFLWYNPLLTLIESGLVLITKLPVNIIVTRCGPFLNALGPICFMVMMLVLFDKKTALASLLSYLFLATGEIEGWGSATYTPWLYPVTFMQFIFYLNIAICYKAFTSQKNRWFLILGITLGLSFLGHTGPTVIILIILIAVQLQLMIEQIRRKNKTMLLTQFKQGLLVFIPFVIVSFPLLYYIIGKYHLKIVNLITVEHMQDLFLPENFLGLLLETISITLVVSILGLVWFYKNCKDTILRKIIFSWLFSALFLFFYSSIIPATRHKFGISLPGIVPSFHFFFYLKALESVLFGIGFCVTFDFILRKIAVYFQTFFKSVEKGYLWSSHIFCLVILLISMIYYPVYANRRDFTFLHKKALYKEHATDYVDTYNYIIKAIPETDVMLCENENSIFPVMATGRKMVSIFSTVSNPYLSYEKRENDRNIMLSYLKSSQPVAAIDLLKKYDVSKLLVENKSLREYKNMNYFNPIPVYTNTTFSIFTKLNVLNN